MPFQFTPMPILFSIGSFNVYSWGLLNTIAILVAGFFIFRAAKKHFSEAVIFEMLSSIVIGGIILARLAFVLINFSEFPDFFNVLSLWTGGMEGFGAIVGGILGALIYSRFKKIDVWKFLDIAAPWLALAFAIGRIGCFLRGCCFGLPTDMPWGILYANGSLASAYVSGAVHPTQIYHSIADFVIFLILIIIAKRKERKILKLKENSGSMFLLFLVLYSIERFIIDFVRWKPATDMLSFGISIQQFAYLIIFAISLIMIIRNRKR